MLRASPTCEAHCFRKSAQQTSQVVALGTQHPRPRPDTRRLHSWKGSVLAQMGLSFDLSTASGKPCARSWPAWPSSSVISAGKIWPPRGESPPCRPWSKRGTPVVSLQRRGHDRLLLRRARARREIPRPLRRRVHRSEVAAEMAGRRSMGESVASACEAIAGIRGRLPQVVNDRTNREMVCWSF